MTYSSPLLSRPGAAAHQGPTAIDAEGVAWHYGNPFGEQRAVAAGTAIIDRSQRRVISVSGPQAAEFLNNLLSQKLDDAPDGFSAAALDLDIQGHILHQADVTRVGDVFYLDVPRAQFDSFFDFLTKMVFWSQVEIAEADLAIVTMLGRELPTPADAVFSRQVEWRGAPRTDHAVPRETLAASISQLESAGGSLAGLMAFTAERVRAVEPELAADLDAKSIPHEVAHWIGRGERTGYVHLNKGCYRGQETVARVENLGRAPRLLVMVYLDGSAPARPEIGADITAGGRRVGRLGSVIDDYEYGPIALALVKRSALTGSQLTIGDTAASVEEDSIPHDEGPKAGRAAVDRLRGR